MNLINYVRRMKTLNDFKMIRYKEDNAEKSCAICLESFITNDCLKILKCNHYFHEKCIDVWLLNFRKTCAWSSITSWTCYS
ncbi:RING finger domain containing protein-like protein [Leptotrombidium deliense]|uniref:RING finger domain containing protein-like protein n=1 Tax=Leptotrombidium deliense TaxID=299467 RepID=A0A443S4J8_9ACAR|nr:RING finger domain containing protein-like protein [Leptotrombidium deliense]